MRHRRGSFVGLDTYSIANLAIWMVSYLVITARALSDHPPFAENAAVRRAVLTLIAILVGEAVRGLLGLTRGWTLPRRMGIALVLILAASAIYAVANHIAFYWISPLWGPSSSSGMDIFLLMSLTIWMYLACCGVYLAISYDAEVRDKSLQLLSAQSLALDAQNRMLRYQINPHFLFNTLNALSLLVLARENGRAEQVILALSSFLRYSLERQSSEKIALSEELEAQRQYLLIERIRFAERLAVKEQISPQALACKIPSLILQPLVENAVKYGVAGSMRTVTITLRAERVGERLRLFVEDDGEPSAGAAPPRLGLGLQNVRQRVEVLYGAAGTLTVGPLEPRGFCARLELPAET